VKGSASASIASDTRTRENPGQYRSGTVYPEIQMPQKSLKQSFLQMLQRSPIMGLNIASFHF